MNKLYETQSYLNNTATTVEECVADGDRFRIRVKESIFFPEEGGQYADSGVILYNGETYALLDGQVIDGEIWYYVNQEIPAGEAIIQRLNWPLRYSRMQQHSGEHIVSGLIHNRFGLDNIGFHLSDDEPVTLTVNGKLDDEQIAIIERMANDVVYMNLPIRDTYPTAEGIRNINYRSKKEIEGQIRLISIGEEGDEIDICACCAPHVKRTGEIGIIKVISAMSYKGGTRIGILCGKRALEYLVHEHDLLGQIARGFSTSADNIPRNIEGLYKEITDLKIRMAGLQEQLILREIDAMPDGGVHCIFAGSDLEDSGMKAAYNMLSERFEGNVGVFKGDDPSGYQFYAGDKKGDSTQLLKIMKEELNAKAGGNAEMIRGFVSADADRIREIFGTA
ncbi:MAG: alanyl-tRNA editing protein [Lachnospiraceae bacterium]|nr:alanyl-tRNA editing protein [Lachnospiraceae bacterium]